MKKRFCWRLPLLCGHAEFISASTRIQEIPKQVRNDNMNQRKKISRIGLLMIFSELLIAVFVFRWLQSEFSAEKIDLQKNLNQQFAEARSHVMDSVISKKYIDPILGSSKGFKIRTVNITGDP